MKSVTGSSPLFVKICGLTELEDALLCARLGAHALGFNFYPSSPRYLPPRRAEQLLAGLPAGILKVAVLVLEPQLPLGEQVSRFLQGREALFDRLQLHGLEGEEGLEGLSRPVWVAVSPSQAHLFPRHDILIDPSWGTGRQADWEELRGLGRPFILSGGLHAGNLAEAVRRLRPRGVDVCSGVEAAPGRKDPARLRAFFEAVNELNRREG